MHVDIKTADIMPIRKTFKHVAKRIGADKFASRYQEATFDLQPDANFHYRPYWDSEHELYDERRTSIVMNDWYAFKDPRQFYYGTWTIARGKQQDAIENSFSFVETHDLLAQLSDESKALITSVIIPLRHVEYAANLNDYFITAYGYGAAITQMTAFSGMDRLANAQYISRIGLMLADNETTVVDDAKDQWLNAPQWQPMRQLVEDLWVVEDWFELFIVQHLVLDGFLYPFAYQQFENLFSAGNATSANNGFSLSLLTEFISKWFTESKRWVDATVKVAAKESPENQQLIEQWINQWQPRVIEAITPIVEQAFGSDTEQVMATINDEFSTRLIKKCALSASS